jgi:SNF2 family DNA or RNA helicase
MNLHPYQERAVEHLHRNPRAGLFMEMGLGKTATVLRALMPEHFPALVVAPKRVAEMVWPEEREKWAPWLTMSLAVGGPRDRREGLMTDANVTVISRDNIADAQLDHYRTVVLDELSSFKSHSSARFKAARKLTKTAEFVWGLTGTPSPNGYLDLWSELYLLDKGERLGTRVTDYRSRYFREAGRLPSGVVIAWELRPGARQRIDQLLGDVCLSVLAADYLTVPEPIVNRVAVPNPVPGIYRELRTTMVADLRLLGPGAIHTAATAAVLGNRLSQLAAGFLYPDSGVGAATRIHHEKTAAVREIVDGTGSPVLVFYRYREELDDLRRALPEARTIDQVDDLQRSWNAGDIPVLLAHPAAIGHGLNLQRGPGHTMVFSSLPWSLEEYQQSVGRLARQGQASRVTVHHLVMPGTIDEAIYDALTAKESVQSALMRYLSL